MSDRIVSRPASEAYRANWPWPEKPQSEADYVCPECTDTEECVGHWIQRMDAWPDSDGGETD